jgi:hypothetical protein
MEFGVVMLFLTRQSRGREVSGVSMGGAFMPLTRRARNDAL